MIDDARVRSAPDNVLGIDFGGTKVALRVERPDGSGADARLRIAEGEAASSVLERTFSEARRLVADAGAIGAIGVATPGVVHEDHVDLAPNVAGWTELGLGARLAEEFGPIPLSVENDVKAAARAEAGEGALHGAGTGLYVNLGTGIAIAPVLDGTVLRGAHGAAGEIGYAPIGPLGGSEERATTLEEHAGGSGLGRRAAADAGIAADDVRGLVALLGVSPAADRLWDDAVDEIARHLITAALTVDPSRIVVGGGMTRAGTALFDPLVARLAAALPYPPEVVASAFGPDASLRGALILARTGLDAGAAQD